MHAPRPVRLSTALATAVLAAAAAVSCTESTAQPQAGGQAAGHPAGGAATPPVPGPELVGLEVGRSTASSGVVAAGGSDAAYNYAPAVMAEDGRTRMWWCSQYGSAVPAGDDILYGEAATVDGPFTGPGGGAPRAVLSGNPGAFDAVHTCDPSVIKVDGTYYLYYTGAAGDHAHGNAIGLATSTDGLTWTRANGGAPIVGPAHDVHRNNVYGAGQPAAVYLDGWFYLMFTDTTGGAAGWNGAGQFLLRAKDPAFSTQLQALGRGGFEPVGAAEAARTWSLVDAFSADLMWVDALDAFAIAHETTGGTTITFWNRDFTANTYRPVLIPGPWREGPGLARGPQGHAPVSATRPCTSVALDVVRATEIGRANAPTGLRRFGIVLRDVGGCADQEQVLRLLDGYAMPSPVRTMDLVTDGTLVRVERRSVAAELATHVLDQRPPELDRIPVTAHLPAGARAVRAPGLGTGFLLDDGKLWPIPSAEAAGLNGSPVEPITAAAWRGYPAGSTLGR